MNILHISDIHFRKTYLPKNTDYLEMLAKMQSPLTHLEECLTEVLAKHRIDVLIISGDLTEDGEVEDYYFLKQWLLNIVGSIPIIVTLGNHDIKSNFREGWCAELPSEDFFNDVMHFPDVSIIAFDNSYFGYPNGIVDSKQFEWLKNQLIDAKGRPIIFVTHHHLLPTQITMPEWPGSKQLIQLLQSHNIKCILNGHTHHPFISEIQGIPYYTVSGMSFIGEDDGDGFVRFEEAYGYNLYRFSDEKITEQSSRNVKPGKLLKMIKM